MVAIIDAPWPSPAGGQRALHPRAVRLVHPDDADPAPELTPARGRQRSPAVQLPADDLGIQQVPVVIAHGPPLLVMEDLDPASTATAVVHQLDLVTLQVT